jgi:hypothetical protein
MRPKEVHAYPSATSFDDSLEMYRRFGPHRTPPEFIMRLMKELLDQERKHGDASEYIIIPTNGKVYKKIGDRIEVEMWNLWHDGKLIATYETHSDAWCALLDFQPQSNDYATRYGGWDIRASTDREA